MSCSIEARRDESREIECRRALFRSRARLRIASSWLCFTTLVRPRCRDRARLTRASHRSRGRRVAQASAAVSHTRLRCGQVVARRARCRRVSRTARLRTDVVAPSDPQCSPRVHGRAGDGKPAGPAVPTQDVRAPLRSSADRRRFRQFLAQLHSRSSAQLGAVAAAITILHATAMRDLGRPAVAGAIAALGMLLDRTQDSRRVTLSVYALSQAFVAAIGFARIRKLVPEALTKPRWYAPHTRDQTEPTGTCSSRSPMLSSCTRSSSTRRRSPPRTRTSSCATPGRSCRSARRTGAASGRRRARSSMASPPSPHIRRSPTPTSPRLYCTARRPRPRRPSSPRSSPSSARSRTLNTRASPARCSTLPRRRAPTRRCASSRASSRASLASPASSRPSGSSSDGA